MRHFYCTLFFICIVFGWVRDVVWAGDGALRFQTISSPNFEVHYYKPNLDLATRVAVVAEYSHAILAKKYQYAGRKKTHIVVLDTTDNANGFAMVVPRNKVQIFTTAPDPLSVLNDYDDWLFLLTAHEYAHIVHLDTIGGLPRWYNRIFGKTWAPNQVQPGWVTEGLATYEESKQSSGGRIRSSIFDMELRTQILDNSLARFDQIHHDPDRWPRGSSRYLYGSHFLHFVFEKYGDDIPANLAREYGKKPIPWSLNRTMRTVSGKTFSALYEEWEEHLRNKYTAQKMTIETKGLRVGHRMTFSAEGSRMPRYSADGKSILWIENDGLSVTTLRQAKRGEPIARGKEYARIDGIGAYDVLSDGAVICDQSQIVRSNYSYRDIVVWKGSQRTIQRLTTGQRARWPRVSPNGRDYAFVKNIRSKRVVAMLPLHSDGPAAVLWEGTGRFDQADMPAWSPDGKSIAFSAWRKGGFRDIAIVDVASRQTTFLHKDRAIDLAPVYSSDGKYLYFASDRGGVYNIFVWSFADKQLHQVTNVLGGAWNPSISPDGKTLLYQGFGRDGWDIYEIDIVPGRWLLPPKELPRPPPVLIANNNIVTAPRKYNPWKTILPNAYSVTYSGWDRFGIQTSGEDILGLHRYFVGADLTTSTSDISVVGSYSYHRFWPTFRLSFARSTLARGGLRTDGIFQALEEERLSLDASVSIPLHQSARDRSNLALAWEWDWRRARTELPQIAFPNEQLPRVPLTDVRLGGVSLRYGFSNVRRAVESLGPVYGTGLSLALAYRHPSIGSFERSLAASYNLTHHQRAALLGAEDTWYLRLSGGIRGGEDNSNRFSIGGVPEQNIADSVINTIRFGGTGYLRGFSRGAAVGTQFHLANIEYRKELFDIQRGLESWPIYLRRLHLAGHLDAGIATRDSLRPKDVLWSLGISLRLDVHFGFFEPGTFDLGISRGFNGGSSDRWEYWLLLTPNL